MCGIFGYVVAPGEPLQDAGICSLLTELFRLSEPRGQEASGLVLLTGGVAGIYKRPLKPSKMLGTPGYARFIEASLARIVRDGHHKLSQPVAVIGHCRLVTNGAEFDAGNNQPILTEHAVGIHNGIITNEAELWRLHPELAHHSASDTEVILRLLDHHTAHTSDLAQALSATFAELEGTASVAVLRDDSEALILATNHGSLYHAHLPGAFVFASEAHTLSSLLQRQRTLRAGPAEVQHLAAGTGLIVELSSAAPVRFALTDPPDVPAAAPGGAPLVLAAMADPVEGLRRCSRCILPITYPFLELDPDGVCSYCRAYVPPTLAGPEALEAELARHRSSDGSPDCIVALSGGRDSSYGLHLLKSEYGMHPVAYSYDWGMVTDIARRNQARMCGQLQIEHILRAADIPAKRRYMRKNILAWLRRPHLGMVPLFMAGDKYFYGIGRQLRQQLKIPLVIFCAGNPLERTDFKGGFAGVRESQHGQRLFDFSLANKLQIAAFYGLQYLLNPAYLNESWLDSLGSFYTTFIGKDDFLYLFHYLEWDEATIDETLIGRYGWETAPHTDNTWRIGDGYTTFINHIYYTVAGFSEFDTFRSQQIRAGLITRDDALARVAEENQADRDVLVEFAAQVGLNLEEVMTRIDAIDKLY
ncbi:MAG TPA: hypothetical protein ENK18_16225 [Deltaproteobacteria bacterium]|nr:hypothetical protein [Deltaproteobacteria bacterium]